MTTFRLGTTRRTSPRAALGPLEHACTGTRASRTGRCYRALCGTAVYPSRFESFDPAKPRACSACRVAIERGATPDA